MKKIEALIKPMKLEQVKQALGSIGVRGITTTEVKGIGRQRAHTEIYRGTEFTVDSSSEVKLEVVLQDSQLDAAKAILLKATKTGKFDEGNVLIVPVETALEHAAK